MPLDERAVGQGSQHLGAVAGEERRRHDELLAWYASVGRDLPWRRTRDPYAVLVSEVMLQQTQVSRVAPRFDAWLERWPDAEALAAASGAEVLSEWSGLGYNSRALRLQAAARAIVEQGWPSDEAGLRALPGIGPYTAAAVAAFAFGLPAAAVDTNQVRVLDRWDGVSGRTAGEVRRRAEALVSQEAPDAWNHALMDLGATICTARVALCDECPVADWCASAGVVDPAAERALRAARGFADGDAGAARRTEPVQARPKQRFEDTQRFVRGRIVAALVTAGAAGVPEHELHAVLPDGISPERYERALAGLCADGLVEASAGRLSLPG